MPIDDMKVRVLSTPWAVPQALVLLLFLSIGGSYVLEGDVDSRDFGILFLAVMTPFVVIMLGRLVVLVSDARLMIPFHRSVKWKDVESAEIVEVPSFIGRQFVVLVDVEGRSKPILMMATVAVRPDGKRIRSALTLIRSKIDGARS
ncbi:MAG: hypothetical protein QM708_16295 [Propioniciclava sp.]|uniref:hypothetical protein n=1 Tax=Propioniciclava sp. TaxID=2038686 RepID=UPI0039E306FA